MVPDGLNTTEIAKGTHPPGEAMGASVSTVAVPFPLRFMPASISVNIFEKA